MTKYISQFWGNKHTWVAAAAFETCSEAKADMDKSQANFRRVIKRRIEEQVMATVGGNVHKLV